ncbi:DUF3800 domain-containing protein [Maribacter stanieri]|uniref:DUF3800 domain-containing protein n=1 Tax=Maribacter stanieri TaxID=440514 RepID=UPI0030DC6C96
MKKAFNLYCDESCHLENDNFPFMLISYISVPYNQKDLHKEKIDSLKKKHNFYQEIKWSKVSKSKTGFYLDLIDYFFASDLSFRAVVVDKTKFKSSGSRDEYDDFYYKMYYQLIYHKLDLESNYNIYLDIKDTLSASKVNRLKDILQYKYSSLKNVQNIRSHESIFMQLDDLIMGALSYHLRGMNKVIAKNKIIQRIDSATSHSLNNSTPKNIDKFNLFFIDLK